MGLIHLSLPSLLSDLASPLRKNASLQHPTAHIPPLSPALGQVLTKYSSVVIGPGREREQCAGLAFLPCHPFPAMSRSFLCLPDVF